MRSRDRKPILWVFSLSRLDDLLASVIPQYVAAADIRVFHKLFQDALDAAEGLIQKGEEVDVFISAGASAAYLRKHATMPVVTIQPTGYDLLQALAKARRLSRRVGIVSFGEVIHELEAFKELYGLEIEQRAYESIEDAEACVRELATKGVEVVVGPSFVNDVSERIGLRGVFIYSQDAVRGAIERAIEIARVARAEEAKRDRIDSILRHLEEGVVAVDQEERIQSVNPAMERLLRLPAEELVGRPLSRVAPGLVLSRVLETGDTELECIQRLGNRVLVTNCIPIREQGMQTGAVLTCQDASAIERVDRRLRTQQRPAHLVARHRLPDAIGASQVLRRARELAERFGRTEATVLVTGESGTGKEIFAQGIHASSARRDRPFVAVNCAALPETLLESELFGYEEGAFTGARRGGKPGLFEIAHTGTIFLDEIGDMPLALQTRLLRVLQQREVLRLGARDATPVDVRVISATNRDLRARIAQGAFREDLYYRLNILKLHLPPLRDRPEDVPLVAARLLDAALARHGAPEGPATRELRERVLAAIQPRLLAYDWPGNVRELENVMERVAVLLAEPPSGGRAAVGGADPADEDELAAVVPELFEKRLRTESDTLRVARRGSERDHVLRVLAECKGNQSQAARKLGIGRTTLWRKLRTE
jgi:transcriptional regulator, propionate catabolism operon regulatory protein